MDGRIEGWTSERYMPTLLNYRDRLEEIPFDFHELLGALAPRPVFISSPWGDTNFKSSSVDDIVRAASPVYRLFRAPHNLQLVHPDYGHDFREATREQAYRFIQEHL